MIHIPDLTPKAGVQTTEFWIALTPIVIAVLAVFGVHLDTEGTNAILVTVGGAVAAVYALSRTVLKVFRIKNAGALNQVASLASKEKEIAATAEKYAALYQEANATKSIEAVPADGPK